MEIGGRSRQSARLKRILTLPLLICFLSQAPAQLFSSQKEARFVHFTAKNRRGIYIRNLKVDEVSIWLDGQEIPAVYLGGENVETAFFFLLENSPRTAPFGKSLPHLGRVNTFDQVRYLLVEDFFQPLVRQGVVALGEFALENRLVVDFTEYDDVLNGRLLGLKPNPSGLNLDKISVGRAFSWALETLKTRPERRKILVLFTQVIDRRSYRNLTEYREMFRHEEVELFVVSFASGRPGMGASMEEKNNTLFFRQVTGETAGRVYITGMYGKLESIMDDLAARLANHFTIGFYVDPNQSPWNLKLQLRDKKTEVFVRQQLY